MDQVKSGLGKWIGVPACIWKQQGRHYVQRVLRSRAMFAVFFLRFAFAILLVAFATVACNNEQQPLSDAVFLNVQVSFWMGSCPPPSTSRLLPLPMLRICLRVSSSLIRSDPLLSLRQLGLWSCCSPKRCAAAAVRCWKSAKPGDGNTVPPPSVRQRLHRTWKPPQQQRRHWQQRLQQQQKKQ